MSIKKVIILLCALMLAFSFCACRSVKSNENKETYDKSTKAVTETVTPIKKDTTDKVASEKAKADDNVTSTTDKEDEEDIEIESVALIYTDPNMDMYLLLIAPGWTYEKDNQNGMVYFYPLEYDGFSLFAISANTQRNGASDDELDDMTSHMWGLSVDNLNKGINQLEWVQKDNIVAGKYTASRFQFTGLINNTEIKGDYLFWWTDEKLYICSLSAYPEEYDEYFSILEEALVSFKTYSELE